ncbi:MAG: FAD-dependent oxidoreductase, partial [Desulfobacteraceae bacterium]
KAYLIIGAGAAGIAAAATIQRYDSTSWITVLSNEIDPPYYRPMLPFLISGEKKATDIALKGYGTFVINGVDIKLNTKVDAINTQRQSVILDNGQELNYDKLLIATGSSPSLPEILKGHTVAGIHTLRTLKQAQFIIQRCRSTRQVVLLGCGMLNIKTAFALLSLGLEVTLVELEKSVLPWLMESDAVTLIHLENIFAAGDVTARIDFNNNIAIRTGLWTHAVEMGRCAGKNMAGYSSIYKDTYGILNATQIANIPFISIGVVHTAGTDYEYHVISTKNTYHKFVFSSTGNRLIGALFIGDIAGAGLYHHLIQDQVRITDIKSHIIKHRLHYGHLLSNGIYSSFSQKNINLGRLTI